VVVYGKVLFILSGLVGVSD